MMNIDTDHTAAGRFARINGWLLLGVCLGFAGMTFPFVIAPVVLLALLCEVVAAGWRTAGRKFLSVLLGAVIGYSALCLIAYHLAF